MKTTLENSFLNSQIKIPGDKSLSHRALILASLVDGESKFQNLSRGEDVNSTIKCLRQLGVQIAEESNCVRVVGVKGCEYQKPLAPLDCGNSGTTMRLLMGVLAAQNFESVLTGDESLLKRPMLRVAEPLRQMGAKIELSKDGCGPVKIFPATLNDLEYELTIASSQVKSALMLAAVVSDKALTLSGRLDSRDHTERMLPVFVDGPVEWQIPGDISAASFWIAASILSRTKIKLENVLLNETRLGFVKILRDMGIQIRSEIKSEYMEPCGDIEVESFDVKPFKIRNDKMIGALIDEIPLLVLLATQAKGTSTITGAEELKYKETNRITKTAEVLEGLGADIKVTSDGFVIEGPQVLTGGTVDSYGDHRLAMMAAVASLICKNKVCIENSQAVSISDPTFFSNLGGCK